MGDALPAGAGKAEVEAGSHPPDLPTTLVDRARTVVSEQVRRPWAAVVVGAFVAVALRELHARWLLLDLSEYRSAVIVDGLLRGRPALLLLAQLAFAVVLVRHRWSDDAGDRALRAVVAVAVATLAFGFAVYEHNEFAGQWHVLDRALLVALAVATFWRLAALPAFLIVCHAIVGQFRWPLLAYSWTDKLAIFEFLWAVQAAIAWQVVVGRGAATRRVDARPALLAGLVVLTAWYLSAGIEKVRLGWLGDTDLSNLVKSAWVEGWLRSVPVGVVDGLADVLSFLNPLLLIGTLLIEIVCVFLVFTTPRLRLVALAGFVALHLMIFLLTGIFFWKWVAVDVAVAVVLLRRQLEFDRASLTASAVAVSVLALQVPVNLAWIDSPVTHAFTVVAVEPDGREFVVPERYFAPFELIISQGRFGYLTESGLVANAYGTLERSIDRSLLDGLDAESLATLRSEHGIVRYSAARSAVFDLFVREQCETWLDRGWLDGWPLVPPPHIWTTDPVDRGRPPSSIETVVVRLDTWLLDDLRSGPVDSEVVRTIDVSDVCGDDESQSAAAQRTRRAVP